MKLAQNSLYSCVPHILKTEEKIVTIVLCKGICNGCATVLTSLRFCSRKSMNIIKPALHVFK